jgi:hypothetical protein
VGELFADVSRPVLPTQIQQAEEILIEWRQTRLCLRDDYFASQLQASAYARQKRRAFAGETIASPALVSIANGW